MMPDVHRLKEHLFRKHKQPKYTCNRCWKSFEEEKQFGSHQRRDPPCLLRPEASIEGFGDTQDTQLRKRKNFTKLSDYDKWRKVYGILFPEIKPNDIPSPFYDLEQTQEILEPEKYSAQHEARLRRELPPRLLSTLEARLKAMKIDGTTKEALKKCCLNVVFEVLDDLAQEPSLTPDVSLESHTGIGPRALESLAAETHLTSRPPLENVTPAWNAMEDFELMNYPDATPDVQNQFGVPFSMDGVDFDFLYDSFIVDGDIESSNHVAGPNLHALDQTGTEKVASDSGYGGSNSYDESRQMAHAWKP
ncbi:putative C2H2-type domain-containing protein [Seiridium cardinale]